MMKRLIGLLLVLAMVVAACGDDDAADPASLNSCEDIAEAGIALFQRAIDEIDGMSAEERAAMLTSEEEPEIFTELETDGAALEARAAEIDCSNDAIGELMAGQMGELSAESAEAQLIVSVIQQAVESGEIFLDQ
ncbi:MAG: hypothetical protein R3290_12100 [Acidimicrobiia bacterium]|nr:hypothetical protein [Acidimicrobiia bacterium]